MCNKGEKVLQYQIQIWVFTKSVKWLLVYITIYYWHKTGNNPRGQVFHFLLSEMQQTQHELFGLGFYFSFLPTAAHLQAASDIYPGLQNPQHWNCTESDTPNPISDYYHNDYVLWLELNLKISGSEWSSEWGLDAVLMHDDWRDCIKGETPFLIDSICKTYPGFRSQFLHGFPSEVVRPTGARGW